MSSKKELWQSVLAQLQFKISKANFATWFKNTSVVDQQENKLIIAVPNTFSKEWLNKNYNEQILEVVKKIDPEINKIDYVVNQKNNTDKKKSSPIKDDQVSLKDVKTSQETNLNSRYTFEEYVVAPFNELAHAATWAVTKNLGDVYNPLFVYGGVGLGKTHLLQAAGNKISHENEDKKIRYIPAEKFVSRIITSIKNHNIEQFKSEIKSLDLLIVDDVHVLAGKEKTQEEFFHIFNSLYENNKQIILSSDRPPTAIPTLEKRLKSRFEGGMMTDIGRPNFESRVAILETKIQNKEVELGDEILEYIASNIQSSIRELEGALNRIETYQKIHNDGLNINKIKSLLKDLIHSPAKITTKEKIVEAVCDFYDIEKEKIFSSSRKQEVCLPRHVAMYLLREELNKSYPSIGDFFKGRDHTTAMHAFKKISKKVEEENKLSEEINLIRQRIYSG